MKINTLPSVEYLSECFQYDCASGLLYWKDRPKAHFQTQAAWKRHKTLRSGKPVLTTNAYGYRVVRISVQGKNKLFFCHRIVYSMFYGDTDMIVDHINGDRLDNRIENLRAVSSRENLLNTSVKRRQGLKGAYYEADRDKWLSQIKINYKSFHLGRFDTEQEAHQAYMNVFDMHKEKGTTLCAERA